MLLLPLDVALFQLINQHQEDTILINQYKETIELYFELKGSPESTQESYYRRMKAFMAYMQKQRKSMEDLNESDIQQYILYLKREKGLSSGTINNYISAVRFFYTYVLQKEWDSRKVPRMRREISFPVIPPKEDVLALINGTTNLKHKAVLMLMYGSGLRVSEVAKLKIRDISSKTMSIRVENTKHNTHRYTILSHQALNVLRDYFKQAFARTAYTPNDWLFPGRNKKNHYHVKSIKNTMIKLRNQLGLDPRISAHTLRHCFATHALEDGVNIVLIQQMLGHKSLKTTQLYLHMTSKSMMGIQSPLDTARGASDE